MAHFFLLSFALLLANCHLTCGHVSNPTTARPNDDNDNSTLLEPSGLNCTCPLSTGELANNMSQLSCVSFSLVEVHVSHFEKYTCYGYLFNDHWLLILDSCLHSYQFEWQMVQVYRLVRTPNMWNYSDTVLYATSEQAFSFPTETLLDWWPPSSSPLPRLMLLKLVLTITNETNGTLPLYKSNCWLPLADETKTNSTLPSNQTKPIQSYVLDARNRSSVQCQLDPFSEYYECNNSNSQELPPIGTGLMLCKGPTGSQLLLGLFVGVHKRTNQLVFLSLHQPQLDWIRSRMAICEIINFWWSFVLWGLLIVMFNVLPCVFFYLNRPSLPKSKSY